VGFTEFQSRVGGNLVTDSGISQSNPQQRFATIAD
jgi:hypothetical protein